MSSSSLSRASAQFNATSAGTADAASPAGWLRRKRISALPSSVPMPATQAPIVSATCSRSLLRTGTGRSTARYPAMKAPSCSSGVMPALHSHLFGTGRIAQVGVFEQLVEGEGAADQALLVRVAQHRL